MLPSGTRLSKAKLLDDGASDGVGFEVAACCHHALVGGPEPAPARAVKSTSQKRCWMARRLEVRAMTLLKWALIFFVVSIVAGVLGFTGISAASADVARFLFYVFVVIFLVLLILGLTIFRV
jgi:uncharacterized membrane protein YtjA (UPF0391 family)